MRRNIVLHHRCPENRETPVGLFAKIKEWFGQAAAETGVAQPYNQPQLSDDLLAEPTAELIHGSVQRCSCSLRDRQGGEVPGKRRQNNIPPRNVRPFYPALMRWCSCAAPPHPPLRARAIQGPKVRHDAHGVLRDGQVQRNARPIAARGARHRLDSCARAAQRTAAPRASFAPLASPIRSRRLQTRCR